MILKVCMHKLGLPGLYIFGAEFREEMYRHSEMPKKRVGHCPSLLVAAARKELSSLGVFVQRVLIEK